MKARLTRRAASSRRRKRKVHDVLVAGNGARAVNLSNGGVTTAGTVGILGDRSASTLHI